MKLQLKLISFSNEFYPKIGGISNYVIESLKTFKVLRLNCEQWVPYNNKLARKYFPFKVRTLNISTTHNFVNLLSFFLKIKKELPYYLNNVLYIAEPGPLRVFSLLMFIINNSVTGSLLNICFHGSEVLQMRRLNLSFVFDNIINKAGSVLTVSNYTKGFTTSIPIKGKGLGPNNLLEQYRVKNVPPSIKDTPTCYFRGVDKPTLKLITIGRLHNRKGHCLTLNNLGGVLKFYNKKKIHYTMVGPFLNKKYFKHIVDLSTKLKVFSSIKLNVGGTNISKEYFLNKIHLMTSVNYGFSVEGFGLVYIEANLRNLFVIANKIGGVGDAMIQKHTGFFINKNIHKFNKIFAFFNNRPNKEATLMFFSKLYSKKYKVYWTFIYKSLVFF